MIIVSIDPALANCGMAKFKLASKGNALELELLDLKLVSTDKQTTKDVRQNSDDLRRAKALHREILAFIQDARLLFAEIPTGAQSARAGFAFGVVTGLMASLPIPVIQIQPSETKLATVGTKTASKVEMIAWASEKFPDAPWKRVKKSGKLLNTNEHLADAVAVAHAGLVSDQFLQLLAMMRKAA